MAVSGNGSYRVDADAYPVPGMRQARDALGELMLQVGHALSYVHPNECVSTTGTRALKEHDRPGVDEGKGRLCCGRGLEEALRDELGSRWSRVGSGTSPGKGQCAGSPVQRDQVWSTEQRLREWAGVGGGGEAGLHVTTRTWMVTHCAEHLTCADPHSPPDPPTPWAVGYPHPLVGATYRAAT